MDSGLRVNTHKFHARPLEHPFLELASDAKDRDQYTRGVLVFGLRSNGIWLAVKLFLNSAQGLPDANKQSR